MKVIYIASAGRSGSTILDISLGNKANYFSCGEIINLVSHGVYNSEYCSCNKKVIECDFWSIVLEEWRNSMELPLDTYQSIIERYQRNKATPSLLWRLYFPNEEFKKSLRDTKLLYEIIAKHSGCELLIDSSKSAQRLLFLRAASVDLKVVLLKRSLKSVLNSVKKEVKKDVKNGIERDFKPVSTGYAIIIWVIDTFLPRFFAQKLTSVKVNYEDLTEHPIATLEKIELNIAGRVNVSKSKNATRHLCAGNRMRMKKDITIVQKKESTGYLSLTDRVMLSILNVFGIK